MRKYKTGIFIGKFFPFQLGHYQTLKKIISLCEKVFLVLYYDDEQEKEIQKELNYNIDERLEDIKKILENKNVLVTTFCPSSKWKFPKDYLEIKNELFKQIKVKSIDLQIFGADEEEKYKNYIYAEHYITGENIYDSNTSIHATMIRKEYDKYKYLLHPIIRKRLDNKLNKQKYICIVGKSGSGKSSTAQYFQKNLPKCIHIDIDKIVHESLMDSNVKAKIINIVNDNILDINNDIDRKKLGNILFQNLDLKKLVYDITWNYVDCYIKKIVKKKYNYVVLDWFNINNKIYWSKATIKILIDRDYESRKQEVLKRDKITEEYFDLREKNSNNYDKLIYDYKLTYSDKSKLNEIIEFLK